jgi:hypothetical protein
MSDEAQAAGRAEEIQPEVVAFVVTTVSLFQSTG